jgi:hypothetical protein
MWHIARDPNTANPTYQMSSDIFEEHGSPSLERHGVFHLGIRESAPGPVLLQDTVHSTLRLVRSQVQKLIDAHSWDMVVGNAGIQVPEHEMERILVKCGPRKTLQYSKADRCPTVTRLRQVSLGIILGSWPSRGEHRVDRTTRIAQTSTIDCKTVLLRSFLFYVAIGLSLSTMQVGGMRKPRAKKALDKAMT